MHLLAVTFGGAKFLTSRNVLRHGRLAIAPHPTAQVRGQIRWRAGHHPRVSLGSLL